METELTWNALYRLPLQTETFKVTEVDNDDRNKEVSGLYDIDGQYQEFH